MENNNNNNINNNINNGNDRNNLLYEILNLFSEDIKFIDIDDKVKTFREYIANVLNTNKEASRDFIFNIMDLIHIRDKLKYLESNKKLDVMLDADKELYNLFDTIIQDKSIDDNFKNTIRKISHNLIKLQLNVLLSICKQYSDELPMAKLIGLINNKLDALNNIYIDKPESEKFKNAINTLNEQKLQNDQKLQNKQPNIFIDNKFGGCGNEDEDNKYYKKYLKYKTKYILHRNQK